MLVGCWSLWGLKGLNQKLHSPATMWFVLNLIPLSGSCSLSGLLLKPSPLVDLSCQLGIYTLIIAFHNYWCYWDAVLCGQGSPVSNSILSLLYGHLLNFHSTLLPWGGVLWLLPWEGVLWVGRSVVWQHKDWLQMRLLCSQLTDHYWLCLPLCIVNLIKHFGCPLNSTLV